MSNISKRSTDALIPLLVDPRDALTRERAADALRGRQVCLTGGTKATVVSVEITDEDTVNIYVRPYRAFHTVCVSPNDIGTAPRPVTPRGPLFLPSKK